MVLRSQHVATPFATPLYRAALVLGGLLILGGCSQMQQPGYYNPPKANSQTDAVAMAEAAYSQQTVRAPSQIQFDIKKPVAASAQTTSVAQSGGTNAADQVASGDNSNNISNETITPIGPSPQAQLIPIAQTFTGTLPCFNREMKCTAQRITLTLAPNGRWRARAAYLDKNLASGKPLVEQGCWRTFNMQQPNIVLLDEAGNARADLAMTANNVLQLRSLNGQTPNLNYTITRQPDVDPIAELDNMPAPKCNN
jgi:hypothetical protein